MKDGGAKDSPRQLLARYAAFFDCAQQVSGRQGPPCGSGEQTHWADSQSTGTVGTTSTNRSLNMTCTPVTAGVISTTYFTSLT
jgi:hypothetical protein